LAEFSVFDEYNNRWASSAAVQGPPIANLNPVPHTLAVVPCHFVSHRAGRDPLVSQRALTRFTPFDFG
jgi:hypothetical protein